MMAKGCNAVIYYCKNPDQIPNVHSTNITKVLSSLRKASNLTAPSR
jgi:hypothetical protein